MKQKLKNILKSKTFACVLTGITSLYGGAVMQDYIDYYGSYHTLKEAGFTDQQLEADWEGCITEYMNFKEIGKTNEEIKKFNERGYLSEPFNPLLNDELTEKEIEELRKERN